MERERKLDYKNDLLPIRIESRRKQRNRKNRSHKNYPLKVEYSNVDADVRITNGEKCSTHGSD